MVGAPPHATEAAANQVTPMTNVRRLPHRSPNDPPSRTSAPRVTKYELTTHWNSARPTSKSRPMAGRATLTTAESRKARPEPRTAADSASLPVRL